MVPTCQAQRARSRHAHQSFLTNLCTVVLGMGLRITSTVVVQIAAAPGLASCVGGSCCGSTSQPEILRQCCMARVC